MAHMTMIEAIRNAHDNAMERDQRVVVFGEDVGYFGGVFRCTVGLQKKYGKNRCFDTPISETGIVGTAIGMAAYGLKPCIEIQFADYMYPAYDRSFRRRHAFGTGPPAISHAHWSSGCRPVVESSAVRRTAKVQKHYSRTSAA